MVEPLKKASHLLIDFENVQTIDLTTLPGCFHVTIFVGNSQTNLPFDLVQGAQCLGSRLEWVKVEGNGRNALDFHIAYCLGCLLTQCPQTRCYILSKDNGFDPLLRYLKKKGRYCRRINSLLDLTVQPDIASDPNYTRVVELLAKTPKNSRPRRRKTLAQHISAMLPKTLPEADVERLIDLLFAEGKVVETVQKLSYTF